MKPFLQLVLAFPLSRLELWSLPYKREVRQILRDCLLRTYLAVGAAVIAHPKLEIRKHRQREGGHFPGLNCVGWLPWEPRMSQKLALLGLRNQVMSGFGLVPGKAWTMKSARCLTGRSKGSYTYTATLAPYPSEKVSLTCSSFSWV